MTSLGIKAMNNNKESNNSNNPYNQYQQNSQFRTKKRY
jgi:hypothetical protein